MKILLDDFVTEHFTWREMLTSATAIRLGLDNTPDSDEIYDNIKQACEALEVIREHFGKPIRILSCYRSLEVNQAVGGSKSSAHLKGLAADFTVKDFSNRKVCKEIPDIVFLEHFDQVIYEFGESGWVHLGLSDGEPRQQTLSAVKENGKTVYKNGLVK